MIPLAAVLERVGGLDEAELIAWVERRWVRPYAAPQGYVFRDIDVARVRLIVEIRRACEVGEESLPLVLSLLDQVCRLRRQLKGLSDAVATQPDAVRERILARLAP